MSGGETPQAPGQQAPVPANGSAPADAPEVPANRNVLWADAIAQELERNGTRFAVIAPGSRSAPLALALSRRLTPFVLLDERSAGYFAVGLAKAQPHGVAVLTSSGTAAANLLPAVVEADQARVRLVVLTADRPPELRDVGANQSIEQRDLFARFVRWSIDLPVPEPSATALRHVRHAIGKAAGFARALRGPVHVNVPLREPLAPVAVAEDVAAMRRLAAQDPQAFGGRRDRQGRARPFLDVTPPAPVASAAGEWRGILAASRRPLVVAGPGAGRGAERLAIHLRAPLLADPQAAVPASEVAIPHADAFLASPKVRQALRPDAIVQVGGACTSRHVRVLLEECRDVPRLVLSPGGKLWDDLESAWTIVPLEAEAGGPDGAFLDAFVASALGDDGARLARNGSWLDPWLALGQAMPAPAHGDWEGPVAQALATTGAFLWVGSSLPIRDIDRFAGVGLRERVSAQHPAPVLANRGASGIDGVVSSAAGAAAGLAALAPGQAPPRCIAYVGDLTFLHDLNGLAAVKRHAPHLTIVVLDNRGGRIFEHLPIAQAIPRAEFEALFATPQDVDIGKACAAFGIAHVRLDGSAQLRQTLDRMQGGVVEVMVDPAVAARRRKEHLAACVEAAEALLARRGSPASSSAPGSHEAAPSAATVKPTPQ